MDKCKKKLPPLKRTKLSKKTQEMFKTIPQNVEKPLTPREKKSKIDYRYWGWMVFGEMCKGTTTVEEKKLGKKAQERDDLI